MAAKAQVPSTLSTIVNAKTWNYILIGTAIVTAIVALRNIYIYSEQIAEEVWK